MIARVSSTHVHHDKVEEGTKLWQEQIIPSMKKFKGFKNVYVLGDDKTHRVVTISLWESSEAADRWAQSDEIRGFASRLSEKVTHQAPVEVFEVKVQG
ncbi:MAG: antibiotic biosynthesis monooxygenase [Acidobacteriota bacterium]